MRGTTVTGHTVMPASTLVRAIPLWTPPTARRRTHVICTTPPGTANEHIVECATCSTDAMHVQPHPELVPATAWPGSKLMRTMRGSQAGGSGRPPAARRYIKKKPDKAGAQQHTRPISPSTPTEPRPPRRCPSHSPEGRLCLRPGLCLQRSTAQSKLDEGRKVAI